MRTGTRRLLTVPAASLVLVCSAGPVAAEEPVSAEVTELPAVLVDELAPAEQHALTDLTEGEGIALAAFVSTPDGPEIVVLEAGRRSEATAAIQLLERQPSVEAASLGVAVEATAGAYTQWGNRTVRSDAARTAVSRGALADVVVAVLDTGVAPHPELRSSLLPGRNFTNSGLPTDTGDRNGHGTHVAGTIAADAGSYVEGVAAGARILPVKVLGDNGSGWSNWSAAGIVWAADHGADVINMSLGGSSSDPVRVKAIDYARSKGVVVIAAAGNAGTSAPQYPAADPGVISVAATAEGGSRAWFSNYGGSIDIAAPGVDILSTYLEGWGHAWMDGTSMASPHVAGVAALVEAAAPALTPDQIERALTRSATDRGAVGRDALFGYGEVDAVRAVASAKALAAPPAPIVQKPSAPRIGTPAGLPGGVRVSWAAPLDNGGAAISGYRVTAYRGTTLLKTAAVSGGTTSTTITGLANGTAYRFVVMAENSAGTGAWSAAVTATPRTTPGAPRITSVTAQAQAVAVRWAPPASNGGAPITGYVVEVHSGGKLLKAVTAGATATSLTVPGLTTGQTYALRVLAKNAAGTGAPSATSVVVRAR